jgi:DNA-binding NtrC family response regulator
MTLHDIDADVAALHQADDVESLEQRLLELACARTDTRNGAIFLWDAKQKGLAVHFHLVDDVVVTLPGTGSVLRKRTDGRPNGIAFACFGSGRRYVANDTSKDPSYAPYFLDVAAVAAVPIPWQGRAIGVLTVSSKKRGAFTDVHVDALESLASAAAKFLRRAQLARATHEDTGRPFLIKGLSPAWLEVERRIEQVSATDAPVLVHGESGTGKDLVSRAIHFNSRRAGKPYVTVNCAAIPETMLESILFGHVRGAFTGASFDKIGELKKADGGTLFLDELGELPLALQAKLLRAIEQGEIAPLGSNKPPEHVDVRFVCATNRDLAAMVRKGTFRDDLYYRVGVMSLELPALRTYKDNLEILAHVLLRQAAEKHDRKVVRISSEAMAAMQAYDFPGNVRELKNALEHAVILATGEEVRPEDLPRSMRSSVSPSASGSGSHPHPPRRRSLAQMRKEWLDPPERRWLADLLNECNGRVGRAAKLAGVDRVTMYRLMSKHGLKIARAVA